MRARIEFVRASLSPDERPLRAGSRNDVVVAHRQERASPYRPISAGRKNKDQLEDWRERRAERSILLADDTATVVTRAAPDETGG
jgi:hypothetical protein